MRKTVGGYESIIRWLTPKTSPEPELGSYGNTVYGVLLGGQLISFEGTVWTRVKYGS